MMARDSHGAALRRGVGAAGLLALAVLVAGCGGSTKAASSPTSAATSAVTSAPIPPPSSAPAAASTTSPPVATTTTVAVAAAKAGSLGSTFCQAAAGLKKKETAEQNGLVDSPAALEKVEKEGLADLPEYQRLAPSSLEAAVAVLVGEDRSIFADLQHVNFDVTALSPTVVKEFQAPTFTRAANQIAAYLTHVCGISPTT